MSISKSQILCLFILILLITWPIISVSQEWSNDQKEVLAVEQKVWEFWADRDLEGYMSCLHDNYIGWFQKDPLPLDKASLRKWESYWLSTTKIHQAEMKPVSITITGNIAIINVYATTLEENAEGKKLIYSRWTDILIREDGRWIIVGTHGGNMEDD